MKKFIFSLIAYFILNNSFFLSDIKSQWLPSSGLDGKSVYCTGTGVSKLFAGTDAYGIYTSTDNGQNWIQSSLNNREVHTIASKDSIIFAGTFYYGVYISTNNGVSWNQSTLNNKNIYTLAISGNRVFAGSDSNGIFISENLGQTWQQSSLNNRMVRAITINGTNIFAGCNNYPAGIGGVYLSTNNGINWVQTSLSSKSVYALTISGNKIYAGLNDTGVYISTNNGQNWSNTTIGNKMVNVLCNYGSSVFAGSTNYPSGTGGVRVTTNDGQNWTTINEGWMVYPTVYSLLIANSYIFAGISTWSVWRRPLSEVIAIEKIGSEIPKSFSLEQNYPNPFNQSSIINFQCAIAGLIQLKVYDIMGKEVMTLVDNEELQPGTYSVRFDAAGLAGGFYFYRLYADGFTITKKLVLLK